MAQKQTKLEFSRTLNRRHVSEGIWILIVVILLVVAGYAAHDQVDLGVKWAQGKKSAATVMHSEIDR